MDMLESLAPPRQRVQYVVHLLDRIASDPNPSIPMMQRAQRLVMDFGSQPAVLATPGPPRHARLGAARLSHAPTCAIAGR
jgi:hypothetical protein